MGKDSKKKFSKLTEERKELLNKVNFVFSTKDDTSKIKELCTEYGVDYKKNKKTLEISSYDFIKIKILFLLENNVEIQQNGIIRDIFSMANENIIASYGISIEELYTKYSSNPKS